MKAVMIMFDSLNRRYLPNYGNSWVKAPNFQRLGQRSITFDNCYCGSMPCMPARRDLHTGRYSFLHRSWGPLEPFDNSMPYMLREAGVYTHLVSDHYHYWEDGGATYHNRYSSWEIVRGQECDRWKGHVEDPQPPANINRDNRFQWVNRDYLPDESHYPQARTFTKGIDFIHHNHQEDSWFLQIETFDPHEPFVVPDSYSASYPDNYDGPLFDWPNYRAVEESADHVNHIRLKYASLVTMCDHYLGMVLDAFDRYHLWDDTMLIVNTDHGYLLGEHGWWAKGVQPCYNEIAHIPLFIHDPRNPLPNQRRNSLCQMIDFAPTLLTFFGLDVPGEMQGRSLDPVIRDDSTIHDEVLFGFHGGHINWTDGRTLYMRAPDESVPVYNYTLMPTYMTRFMPIDELAHATLVEPFPFSKGLPLLKVPGTGGMPGGEPVAPRETMLFDVVNDPEQQVPLNDALREKQAGNAMLRLMQETDAPREIYERYGFELPQ